MDGYVRGGMAWKICNNHFDFNIHNRCKVSVDKIADVQCYKNEQNKTVV